MSKLTFGSQKGKERERERGEGQEGHGTGGAQYFQHPSLAQLLMAYECPFQIRLES